VHAVNRLAVRHPAFERLQHVAVAAEGDDDVGIRLPRLAIGVAQTAERFLGLGTRAGGEMNAHQASGLT